MCHMVFNFFFLTQFFKDIKIVLPKGLYKGGSGNSGPGSTQPHPPAKVTFQPLLGCSWVSVWCVRLRQGLAV